MLRQTWDLRPFAEMLAPVYTSPQTTEYIKIQYWTKNNCVHALWGKIIEKTYEETKKPNCQF